MQPTERQIRDAIVALVQVAAPDTRVYNRFRRPADGLISEFNLLNVDDDHKINVCFVRRVSFQEQVTSFDDPIAAIETYILAFYRGIEDDIGDGTDSENWFQLLIEAVRAAFKVEANKHLGFDNSVSQGGMTTESPFVDSDDFSWSCHRFIGRLNVALEEC
jgi:hypothetical protein